MGQIYVGEEELGQIYIGGGGRVETDLLYCTWGEEELRQIYQGLGGEGGVGTDLQYIGERGVEDISTWKVGEEMRQIYLGVGEVEEEAQIYTWREEELIQIYLKGDGGVGTDLSGGWWRSWDTSTWGEEGLGHTVSTWGEEGLGKIYLGEEKLGKIYLGERS